MGINLLPANFMLIISYMYTFLCRTYSSTTRSNVHQKRRPGIAAMLVILCALIRGIHVSIALGHSSSKRVLTVKHKVLPDYSYATLHRTPNFSAPEYS